MLCSGEIVRKLLFVVKWKKENLFNIFLDFGKMIFWQDV